ncbi:MAG: helix-turn-helix transcriptional regulator [Clostridiales bacterium]|nr:helix-turn-helix transcriptional regulator [Clostridiales bacterium]
MYKEFFYVSPKEDILNAKLEYAKQLLTTSSLTLQEIADKCGFSDKFTFIRFFKARMGVSPAAWLSK